MTLTRGTHSSERNNSRHGWRAECGEPKGRLMRIVFIKFGNHAEDEKRLAAGGGEAYYAKRYTMDYFTGLVKSGWRVLILAVDADAPFVVLPSGVESVGVRLYPGRHRRPRFREVIHVAESWGPTHLVVLPAG